MELKVKKEVVKKYGNQTSQYQIDPVIMDCSHGSQCRGQKQFVGLYPTTLTAEDKE